MKRRKVLENILQRWLVNNPKQIYKVNLTEDNVFGRDPTSYEEDTHINIFYYDNILFLTAFTMKQNCYISNPVIIQKWESVPGISKRNRFL